MSGWTKLFSSIVTSSVWVADDATLRVWVAMLATADADGVVEGSVPGFANLARVTTEQMRIAVSLLSSPDADSRTPDHEGRRIEAVEGGWRILNYGAYRERGQAKDGSKAPAMRAYRARKRAESGNALPKKVTGEPEERGERREERKEEESCADAPPGRPEQLQALWNELTTPPLPRCKEMTSQRKKQAEARLRERGLDGMRAVFGRINELSFCRGDNPRGWKANFDWALKPASIARVLEGNYEGGGGRSTGGAGTMMAATRVAQADAEADRRAAQIQAARAQALRECGTSAMDGA